MNKLRFAMICAAGCAAIASLSASTAVAADDRSPSPVVERRLIEVLRNGAPAEKALACKQLAIHGTKEAVPDLSRLLTDPQLNSWARTALEVITDPAADEALRAALPALKGRLLVGTINSIGVRRDAAAVDALAGQLKGPDTDAAAAAAVALGRIGNAQATGLLQAELASGPARVRSAVAEGCILCAERHLADGKATEAADIYDAVRRADLPQPRVLEATRGAILARQAAGVPLLVEQLKSADRNFFRLGLTVARELPGPEVADALASELVRATPERGALLLSALADRHDTSLPATVLVAAKSGDKQIRIAAIGVIGRLGDAASVPTLLEIATDADAELAQAAQAALVALPGETVNAEIAARLPQADGKALPVLIALVGQRRIATTAPLIKALDHADPAVRGAALTALGETVDATQLPVLIQQVISPRDSSDAQVALRALRAACVRMPQRDECAAEVSAALAKAPPATKASLLEVLAAVGGPKALATVGAAVRSGDAELQDTGSRLLGEWMTADAGPVLLDLAKNPASDKYQLRALRGYIRIARQMAMADAPRAQMCQSALEVSNRPEEQKMVLGVLERYPSVDSLKVAVKATETPALKDDAARVALAIAQKIGGGSADAQALLAKVGLDPVKVEIIKAEYGAGSTQKDVTDALRGRVRDLPLITLESPRYNDTFGGDPVPGTIKQLKVQYRINGKPGEASFAENAMILLPMPK